MDSEALFLRAVLDKGVTSNLRLIRPGHISDGWRPIYDFVFDFVKKEKKLPERATLENKFLGKPPLFSPLPNAPEGPSYYARNITDNAMRILLEEGLTEEVAAPLREFNPTEALKGAKKVVAEVSREFRELDRGLILPDLSDNTKARWVDYQFRKKAQDRVGLPTLWPSLTIATGGLHAGDMWVLLARPATGKSGILVAHATHLWKTGFKVLFVSMETPPQGASMPNSTHRIIEGKCFRCFAPNVQETAICEAASIPRQRLTIRFDSCITGVSLWRLSRGLLTPFEEQQLEQYYRNPKSLGTGQLKIIAAPAIKSVTDVEMEILEYKPDIVFWDSAYLGAVGSKKTEAAAELVIDFKLMLERVGIPGIISWHFNREVKPEDSDASMNSAILTDEVGRVSDVLLGLFRTNDMELASEALIRTLKVRDGMSVRELKIAFALKDKVDFSELNR